MDAHTHTKILFFLDFFKIFILIYLVALQPYISNPKRWCCESAALNMPANWENSAVVTGLKRSVFIPITKKGNAKECSNNHMITLISHASKVMLKILQASFSNTWTVNIQMFKLVLEKAEKPEIKLPTSAGSLKNQESSKKTSISPLLAMPKPLTVWITINCGKLWKRWEYQTTWPASWEICMQVRKQQFELDIEQQTGSK